MLENYEQFTPLQASMNRQKTTEKLQLQLAQINEAVDMATGNMALFNTEATRKNSQIYIKEFSNNEVVWSSFGP